VGDAAGQLAEGAQPFVLHDGVLRLAKFVVGPLQLSVQARLMRGQSDVRAERPQKLAFADAESIGPDPGRDENAKQIPLDNHGHDGGGAHLNFGQLFEQRRLGFAMSGSYSSSPFAHASKPVSASGSAISSRATW